MNSRALMDWIQLLTGLAVLFGLALVVWELNQTRELAKAQQAENGLSEYNDSQISLMGESPSRVIAKACEDPASLTMEDSIIMNAYYAVVVNRMRRGLIISKQTDIVGNNWQQWTGNFHLIFSTEYGRWWFENASWEPEIMEAGQGILASGKTRSCSDNIEQYQKNLLPSR